MFVHFPTANEVAEELKSHGQFLFLVKMNLDLKLFILSVYTFIIKTYILYTTAKIK